MSNVHGSRLASMWSLRPGLCDVRLIADDGREVSAHKVVLAAALPYFSAMFTAECDSGLLTGEATASRTSAYIEAKLDRIPIRDIDGPALEQIVRWCYLGTVEPSEDNVQPLLSAAKMLDSVEICNICAEFIKSRMTVDNALGIYQFADHLQINDLQSYTQHFIHNHFIAISKQSEEFLALDLKQLMNLISSDYIDCGDLGEEAVLKAVMTWIEYEHETRQEFLPALLEHVRFPRLSQESLIRIEDEYPALKADATCKDLLIEAMKFHLSKGSSSTLNALGVESDTKNERFRLRSPQGRSKCLLVVGGQAPKAIRQCEYYDFGTEIWNELPSELPSRRCRAGLAIIHNAQTGSAKIFTIGGFNGSLRVRTVDCYDTATNQWYSCPSMEARRSTLGVGVLSDCSAGDMIYAVGGFDGSSGLATAEVFSLRSQKWSLISPMSTKRSSVGVTTMRVHGNGVLFAVGGYDGASRQCLSSVESYNPATDTWTLVSNMSMRRSGAATTALNSLLYSIGGHDGPAIRKSVECYDPNSNLWMQCADMIVARRNAGVVGLNGLLYVVGGDDGHSNLSSVEVYDPRLNSWSLLTNQMSVGRSYAGVCMLDKNWP